MNFPKAVGTTLPCHRPLNYNDPDLEYHDEVTITAEIITIKPYDINKVELTLGNKTVIIDGPLLCDAVNTMLGKARNYYK